MSCGNKKKESIEEIVKSNNLEKIKEKYAEVKTEEQALLQKLKILDSVKKVLEGTKNLQLITTYEAKEEVFNHYIEIQGSVVTKQNIILYPEFTGTLTHVYVTEGQQVSKGQILAKIDDSGLGQQLAQVKVQENLAKTTYERQKRLWEQNIGSEIQYLQAETNYKAQQSAVKQLLAQLSKTNVVAPFSGVIDDVISEQGSVVVPGQSPILRIVNLNDMYVEAEVPENYLPDVVPGKQVEAFFPVLNKTVTTKVRQVGSYINPNNRSFKIEVGIPNKNNDVKPNLTTRLKINDYTNEQAILIPQNVISENGAGDQYIYIVTDIDDLNRATAKQVFITTGKTQGDFIEVLSGINAGDQIISEGARSVQNEQQIEIMQSN
jgi:RND family efflux transporter MFP subunit